MTSASFTAQLQRQTPSLREYIPFISGPAVHSDTFTTDESLIVTRAISGFALSCIAMAALYWTCPPVALFAAKYQNLAVCGSALLPFVPGALEFFRAHREADRLAVEEYRKPIPSALATERIYSSQPAFQRVLDSRESLHKRDSQGVTLAYKLLSYYSSAACRMLVDTDIDLLAVDAQGQNLFMAAVANPDPFGLRHILKSRKVEARNVSEELQAKIWKHAQTTETIALLCQYGFNINVRDAEGMTPLMRWANRRVFVVAALNAGANPLLQNPQGLKASQMPIEDHLALRLLLQAEGLFGTQAPALPQGGVWLTLLPWRPFVARGDHFLTADYNTLSNYQMATYFATFTLCKMETLINVLMLSSLVIGTELWRGDKEARRQAVVDYLKNPVPSRQATNTLCKNLFAARLLIQYAPRSSMSKLDAEGASLLTNTYLTDPEIFKLLVDHGADIFAGTKHNGFLRAVQSNNPELLAHILDGRLVNVQTMPVDLQVKMWSSVGSVQNARFLQQYGFNPNISDAAGNTPLMHLAQGISGFPVERIRTLLTLGADRTLRNRAGQTARDLATDPVIAALL